ncbi:hypothetical protein [Dactylosporangium sp. CS-033363]|uniref:hypothetical protein n=1 Tax=Dactylosporangium sp. CS-033363 TaxID=3239935 RepID=UPI003D8F1558
MLEEALVELASVAGATIATAMATDAWQTARNGIVRLLGRGGSDRAPVLEGRLDRDNSHVAEAGDPAAMRRLMSQTWTAEFEGALDREPDLVDDLRALIDEIGHELTPPERTWIQQNVTVGGSNNVVPVVGKGNVVFHNGPSATA